MFKKKQPTAHELEVSRLYDVMHGATPGDKDYEDALKALVTLTELNPKRKMTVSGDAILGAVVNVLSTGAVLHHEQMNVITSKAFGWIKPLPLKGKI